MHSDSDIRSSIENKNGVSKLVRHTIFCEGVLLDADWFSEEVNKWRKIGTTRLEIILIHTFFVFRVQKYIEKRLSECRYMSYELIWKYSRKESWQMEREKNISDIDRLRGENVD